MLELPSLRHPGRVGRVSILPVRLSWRTCRALHAMGSVEIVTAEDVVQLLKPATGALGPEFRSPHFWVLDVDCQPRHWVLRSIRVLVKSDQGIPPDVELWSLYTCTDQHIYTTHKEK